MITISLVDDSALFRDAIKSLLTKEKDLKIIGEAENGKHFIRQLEQGITPNVALVDFNMPEMNGLETTKFVSQNFPQIKVIIVTNQTDKFFANETVSSGAKGFISKTVSKEVFIEAIHIVHTDKEFISIV